jgi:hypothetical protein
MTAQTISGGPLTTAAVTTPKSTTGKEYTRWLTLHLEALPCKIDQKGIQNLLIAPDFGKSKAIFMPIPISRFLDLTSASSKNFRSS